MGSYTDENKRGCEDKVCKSPWGCSSFSPSNKILLQMPPNSNRKDQVLAFELRLEVITLCTNIPRVLCFYNFSLTCSDRPPLCPCSLPSFSPIKGTPGSSEQAEVTALKVCFEHVTHTHLQILALVILNSNDSKPPLPLIQVRRL